MDKIIKILEQFRDKLLQSRDLNIDTMEEINKLEASFETNLKHFTIRGQSTSENDMKPTKIPKFENLKKEKEEMVLGVVDDFERIKNLNEENKAISHRIEIINHLIKRYGETRCKEILESLYEKGKITDKDRKILDKCLRNEFCK